MLAVGPLGPQYSLLLAWYELGRHASLDGNTLPSQKILTKMDQPKNWKQEIYIWRSKYLPEPSLQIIPSKKMYSAQLINLNLTKSVNLLWSWEMILDCLTWQVFHKGKYILMNYKLYNTIAELSWLSDWHVCR